VNGILLRLYEVFCRKSVFDSVQKLNKRIESIDLTNESNRSSHITFTSSARFPTMNATFLSFCYPVAQRLDLFAWCVRLNRLLVGFRTHCTFIFIFKVTGRHILGLKQKTLMCIRFINDVWVWGLKNIGVARIFAAGVHW